MSALVDTIHDTLSTGHGCAHPRFAPAECERVAAAIEKRDPDMPDPDWDEESDGWTNREGDPNFNGAFNRW